MARRGIVTGYRVVWAVLLAGFVALVWWLIATAPAERILPGELQSASEDPRAGSSPTIDDTIGATNLSLKGAELTVSSSDGKMKLRVRADSGRKERGLYSIEEGSLQFTLGERDTLVLRLNNATYRREAGVVKVAGTLLGHITDGDQYFKAAELSWDQSSNTVRTSEISYVGPGFEVSGEQMSIDLPTGVVHFHGPVEMGI
jgi:hypothetical protein